MSLEDEPFLNSSTPTYGLRNPRPSGIDSQHQSVIAPVLTTPWVYCTCHTLSLVKEVADLPAVRLALLCLGQRRRRQRIKSVNGVLRYIDALDRQRFALNKIQQLLNVWRKAKGKERDALLWGDEVRHFPGFQAFHADGADRVSCCSDR